VGNDLDPRPPAPRRNYAAPRHRDPNANDGDRTGFELSEEEHQRFPGDYETQVGQGPVTLHSTERLTSSDRGVSMVRRQFTEQVQVVASGGDPVGVCHTTWFDERQRPEPVVAGNYIVDASTDLAEVPLSSSLLSGNDP
jgi:hypothetical protein